MASMPAPRSVACALVVAAALGAAGCTSTNGSSAGDFTGAEKEVATTIDHLQSDIRSSDADKVCSRDLSRRLVDQITKKSSKSCASALDDPLKDVSDANLDVKKGDITINGNRATARVTSGSGSDKRPDTLTFVRERGGWKLDGLGG
jgi:hypothetical protein